MIKAETATHPTHVFESMCVVSNVTIYVLQHIEGRAFLIAFLV